MCILRPFIYDPLVEWSKPPSAGKRKGKHSDTGEATNEQAMTHVQTIENRLTGTLLLCNIGKVTISNYTISYSITCNNNSIYILV